MYSIDRYSVSLCILHAVCICRIHSDILCITVCRCVFYRYTQRVTVYSTDTYSVSLCILQIHIVCHCVFEGCGDLLALDTGRVTGHGTGDCFIWTQNG